jgi:hypothetical protein
MCFNIDLVYVLAGLRFFMLSVWPAHDLLASCCLNMLHDQNLLIVSFR